MAVRKSRSPFERLRQKYEDAEFRCRACGYVDEDGGWRVTTTGSRVQYQQVCQTCGAMDTRELRL